MELGSFFIIEFIDFGVMYGMTHPLLCIDFIEGELCSNLVNPIPLTQSDLKLREL